MPLPDCGCDSSFLKYPDDAGAGAVQDEWVELAAAIVVEREGPVGGRPQVVAADPNPRVALRIYRGEAPAGVRVVVHARFLEYPDGAGAGAVQDEVVELAAAVVVEREGPVGG